MADVPDDVDISGMPDPPADLTTDISDMPTPADLFKQRVGRAPDSDQELQQFTSHPENFAGDTGTPSALASGTAGAAEEFAKQGTGLVASIPAGIAYGGAAIAKAFGKDVNPDQVQRDVQAYFTYKPHSEAAKAAEAQLAETYGPAWKSIVDAADKATKRVGEVSPTAESLLRTAPGAAQAALGIIPGAQTAKGLLEALPREAGAGETAEAATTAGASSSAPAQAPTAPTPAVEGSVTGEALRAQPDPLASVAPAEAPAASANVAAPPGAAPKASVRVPGKPHITLKAQTSEPASIPTPAPTVSPAEPVRFSAPSDEGASTGALPAEDQNTRLQTLQNLNQLAGGQLGEVRTSAITGDTGETGADWAHAKVQDAGGKRMQDVIGNETNAVRSAANNLVDRTGTTADGVDQPALRQRGTVISDAVRGIEKWFDDNIKSLYTTAKQRANGIPIQNMPQTRALIGTPSEFYGTTEGEALHRGVVARAQHLGLMDDQGQFRPATVNQAEQFRQYLGEQWTPRTAGVIGKLKDALDSDVAQHGGADLFDQARSLRSRRATLLDDPTGIAKLLHPDDRLGINRDVPLEQVPDYIANLPTDQFNHVINVLKSSAHLGNGELADSAAAAIREIKGHMAAKLHDAGSAPIQGGWSAKGFYKQLNQYSNKMPSVFSPKEMGDWKTVNDASNTLRMDRTYKGAKVEELNTGIGASLRAKAGHVARGATDTLAHHVLPGAGPVMAEMTGIPERIRRFVGGDPEAAAERARLAQVERRITPLNQPENAPTLGQTIGGGRQRGGPRFENNASGESSASLEAQSRVAQERAAGQGRYQIDPDGNVTPLTGVDSVDAKAPRGHVIVQRGIGNQPYSVLDRGGMNAREAQGLVARAQGLGKLQTAERTLADMFPGQRGGPKKNQLQPGGYGKRERKVVGYGKRQEVLPAQTDESMVNIGLNVGDKKGLTPAQVTKVLEDHGVNVKKTSVHQSNSEPTMVATLDRPMTPEQASRVSGLLKQDAIAQVSDGKGELYGPKADDWKPFNRDYFLGHDGKFISDHDTLLFRHYGDAPAKAGERVLLDPAKYGQGLTGAERMRIASGAPKVVSAYGLEGEVEPGVANRPQFSIHAKKGDMYDLSNDPKGFKQAVMDDNNGVYDHTEVEHAIKAAGYKGYYLPKGEGIFKGQARFFEKTPAIRITPDETPAQAQPLGAKLFGGKQREAVGNLNKQSALPAEHLTDEEKTQLRADTSQKLIDAFHKDLPPTEEYAAAAMAGKAKKGWYENSAKAIANVFGPDAPRFSALLASMSPQVSVQGNFHNALRTFINWDKAGRPTSDAAIRNIMEESSLKGSSDKSKQGGSNVLNAWVPNAIRSLKSESPETLKLSGPKVHSFMRNLQDNVNEVTNDAWMASFANMDPSAIGGKGGVPGNKRPAYMAMSAKVRAAAKLLTHMTGESWTPREVQETVWSWAKTAYEHADSFGGLATIPELVKHKEITDDLIKSTPDFHQLFSSPEHSEVIGNSRYAENANRVDVGQGQNASVAGSSKKAAVAERALKPHLEAAAKRLEEVRQDRAKSRGEQ